MSYCLTFVPLFYLPEDTELDFALLHNPPPDFVSGNSALFLHVFFPKASQTMRNGFNQKIEFCFDFFAHYKRVVLGTYDLSFIIQ